jgi:hypothetical protein
MQWRIQPSGSWIGLTSTTGILSPGATANVVVSMNTSASLLPPGRYTGVLLFTNLTNNQGNTSKTINLVVTATTGSANMSVSPTTGMTFTGPVGGPFAYVA